MRRGDKEIRDAERIDELLRSEQVLRLALTDDGAPYVLPMSFVRDGDDLYLHSAAEGRKIDLIRRNPRVGFELDRVGAIVPGAQACGFSVRYRSVIGEGTAEFVEGRGEKRRVLLLLMEKYAGTADWTFPDAAVDRTAVIRVRVDRLSAKESPAGKAEA